MVAVLLHQPAASEKESHTQIVKVSLEVLQNYLGNSLAQKYLMQGGTIQKISSAHVTQFRILQEPHQLKQLQQFFRVLANLWLSEEHRSTFQDNLS